MILLLLLSVVPLSIAAIPKIREQEPMVLAIDGIESFLYDEMEDPQILDYEMSAIAGSPILSLLQMVKKQSDHKDKFISSKEKFALAKQSLDEIITRLQTIRTRLENGNGNIHYSDIEKSIDGLKKLERSFRPDITHLLSAMHQSMAIANPIIKGEILEVRTITGAPTKMPSTEKPVFELEPVPFLQPVPVVEPAPKIEPAPTEGPVTTEVPVTEDAEEVVRKPYAMEVYKSHKTEFKKKDDDDNVKPLYPSRFTWKTSSLL